MWTNKQIQLGRWKNMRRRIWMLGTVLLGVWFSLFAILDSRHDWSALATGLSLVAMLAAVYLANLRCATAPHTAEPASSITGDALAHKDRERAKRQRTEDELRKLWVAVEQSPATIVVTDRNGEIEYANPKFCAVTGYTFAEARGRNPRFLKSGEMQPEEYKRLWDTILSGHEWHGEFHNKRKDGSLYWEQAVIAPVTNADGEITSFIAVKEDVTERKRVKEEMERMNRELQKASEVKSAFLANMSHEIRTPLNAIVGMTGLLLDTKLDAEQRDCSETIRNSSEILLTIINDILDFSKIEAERMELESQPFDLTRCVAEAMELVSPKAVEKGIAMACNRDENLPRIFVGDVTRLRQIFVNLLNNAVKFTEQGEVVMSACVDRRDGDQYELHFSVRDTGLGIPPDRQDRLFQSFSQVDASTSRRFGGTGLGLAISKRLCELLGGRMWVESAGMPGQGSTFHFTILATKAAEQSLAGDAAQRGFASGQGQTDDTTPSECELRQRGRLRVLLAEDNPINQRVAVKILAKIGYRADVVADGREALEASQRIAYDVILMDCQMPEIDGYEATRQIRMREQEEGRPPVHIIAMTAHAMQGDREVCLAAGMDDYLSKPVRANELEQALLRCHAVGVGENQVLVASNP